VIIHGIEEHDLRAALEVANYAYKGNLCFREGPATLSSPQSWRVRLSVKDPEGPGYRRWVYRSWWHPAWWDQRKDRHISRFATMPIGISSTLPLSARHARE
jgi:hypothetical protein